MATVRGIGVVSTGVFIVLNWPETQSMPYKCGLTRGVSLNRGSLVETFHSNNFSLLKDSLPTEMVKVHHKRQLSK